MRYIKRKNCCWKKSCTIVIYVKSMKQSSKKRVSKISNVKTTKLRYQTKETIRKNQSIKLLEENQRRIKVTHFQWNYVCVCALWVLRYIRFQKRGNLRINSSVRSVQFGNLFIVHFVKIRFFFVSFFLFERSLLNVQLVNKSLFNRASIDNLSNSR